MFKSVDNTFDEIRFKKISDDEHGVIYEKPYADTYIKFTHVISIEKKRRWYYDAVFK